MSYDYSGHLRAKFVGTILRKVDMLSALTSFHDDVVTVAPFNTCHIIQLVLL